jgi:hypothetical protein
VEVDAIAGELVAKVTALLSSNPESQVRATSASAFLAIEGWCVETLDVRRAGRLHRQRGEHE